MNRAIKYFYFLVLAFGVAYMVSAVLCGGSTVTGHLKNTGVRIVEPVTETVSDGGTAEYILALEELSDDVSMALEFYTSHQYVQVYAGEELVYAVSGGQTIFGHSTGSRINVVELPVQTESVRIVLQSVFGKEKKAPDFYYGDIISVYHDIVQSSVADAGMSLLIIVFGFLLIFYWLVVHKRIGQNPAIVYFGLFSVMIGLWTLNETDLFRLLFSNRTVASMISYLLLSLVIVPFVQFVRYFFEKEKAALCNVICFCATVETVVLTLLHMSGIAEFKQTSWTIHGMMFIGLGYMAFAVRERIKKYGMDHKVRVNAVAMLALFVSVVTDLAAYYTDLQRSDILGKLGFLVYVFILGKESAADTFKKIQEGEKARSYLKLAMTDVMTGLHNRSAFESWEEKCTDLQDVMIVTFDLNNLKYCNDNLGHAAGDTYIVDAARMIHRVFGAIAQCYRIGGDEFCAVIQKASRFNIEKYLDKLRAEQYFYNKRDSTVKINIAAGYAIHAESDVDMEETRSRADVNMYRNKKKLKENGEW